MREKPCTHQIPIINEGAPTLESDCDRGRTHFVIVVHYGDGQKPVGEG